MTALASAIMALTLVIAPIATAAAGTSPAAEDARAEPCAESDHGIGHIESFDGTSLEFSCFKPEGASPIEPVPLIIRMHGFGGQYDADGNGRTQRLVAAGYGVLSYSSRGHGGSGGETWSGHPDYEVRDLRAILDWVHDHMAWVQQDSAETGIARDTRVGLAGGSMGAQVALVAAAQDPRIDAIMAATTPYRADWTIAPNDVGRTRLDVFVALSAPNVRPAPALVEGYATFKATRRMSNEFRTLLIETSAATHISSLAVPVFFLAGMTDNYTALDQTLALAHTIERNGAPVKVFTDNLDHIGAPPDPRTGITEPEPCGSYEPPSIEWFNRYVKRLPVDTGPAFSAALDDGSCAEFRRLKDVTSGWRKPAGPRDPIMVPGSHLVAGVVDIPLGIADAVLIGVPSVSMRVRGGEVAEWHLFAELVAGSGSGFRSIDSQVLAFRDLTATACTDPNTGEALRCVSAPIGGVGSVLRADEELVLRLSTSSEWYWDSQTTPVTVSGIEVDLPIVTLKPPGQ